jgi:3',5'-cyclic AMP phosphodiesterase CpdA
LGGKLRKLSHLAEGLVAEFATRMREDVAPDFVVNLGDLIEDEAPDADAARYMRGVAAIAAADRAVIHVAGNHDRIHLAASQLRQMWGMPGPGPLYRSFEHGDMHVVVLATHETKNVEVTIDDEQLAWLVADLDASASPVVVLMHHSAAEQELRHNRWFAEAPHLCLVKQRKRLRSILAACGRVRLVLNGHLHWNHVAVIDGTPYVTLQSLIENVHDDAPGVAAAAHAVVRISPRQVHIEVGGVQPVRYQFLAGACSPSVTPA